MVPGPLFSGSCNCTMVTRQCVSECCNCKEFPAHALTVPAICNNVRHGTGSRRTIRFGVPVP